MHDIHLHALISRLHMSASMYMKVMCKYTKICAYIYIYNIHT